MCSGSKWYGSQGEASETIEPQIQIVLVQDFKSLQVSTVFLLDQRLPLDILFIKNDLLRKGVTLCTRFALLLLLDRSPNHIMNSLGGASGKSWSALR